MAGIGERMALPTFKREYIMNKSINGYSLEVLDVILINGLRSVIREMEEPQEVNKWVNDKLVKVEMVNCLVEDHNRQYWTMLELNETFVLVA